LNTEGKCALPIPVNDPVRNTSKRKAQTRPRHTINLGFIRPDHPRINEQSQMCAKPVFDSAAGLPKPISATVELMTATA
jgi:hypothetical protein